MGFSVVCKEQILVLRVNFNPMSQLGILNKMMVGSCAKVAGVAAKKQLLEVRIIEDIWVHGPSRVWAFCSTSFETNSVGSTHQSNKIFRS